MLVDNFREPHVISEKLFKQECLVSLSEDQSFKVLNSRWDN
jgi:hypothetical protein